MIRVLPLSMQMSPNNVCTVDGLPDGLRHA
ncbi:Uncharacterised protein [Bordetella ansorpii]|uniref:Uncharacterized protein n=1 Tax=Bordetella ansorpii TaxID=288768 RepID=A0A157R930_9BORD|nr:Uncharacterised protein [Bordetella ansorpii]